MPGQAADGLVDEDELAHGHEFQNSTAQSRGSVTASDSVREYRPLIRGRRVEEVIVDKGSLLQQGPWRKSLWRHPRPGPNKPNASRSAFPSATC